MRAVWRFRRNRRPVFRLREHVKLTSNHPELLWVNLLEIWASGTFDFTNGRVRVCAYAL